MAVSNTNIRTNYSPGVEQRKKRSDAAPKPKPRADDTPGNGNNGNQADRPNNGSTVTADSMSSGSTLDTLA